MNRGVLWIVWNGKPGLTGCGQVPYPDLLERSRESARKHLPGVPQKVVQVDPADGLLNKTRMGRLSPFESTLFLDADAVIVGDLSYAWLQAERHGLACCIGQCPWLRRYGRQWGDQVEYNTGVLLFDRRHKGVADVLELWEKFGTDSPGSRFTQGDTVCGLDYDDQFAFSRAVGLTLFNPYILPPNYNFMPGYQTRFFTPLKVWHSIHPVPEGLEERSLAAASGQTPIGFCEIPVPGG